MDPHFKDLRYFEKKKSKIKPEGVVPGPNLIRTGLVSASADTCDTLAYTPHTHNLLMHSTVYECIHTVTRTEA